ncbi:S30AE family protein [Mycobacterium tuberculosis T46]|nr:S30AE family protein [Mycobacterium tuberculosis T46]
MSRSPTTSASTFRRNSPAWSGSTGPSTCSTSNSTTNVIAASASPVSAWRSPRVARAGGASEACADSFYAALESAVVKLESRLRRGKDRRKVHYGDKTPVSLAEATAVVPAPENGFNTRPAEAHDHDGAVVEREPGRIVRTKEHPAKPMSVDDALYQMELVGHDFFLFYDKDTERPSVVYRRHAYDYGLIRLA